MSETMINGDLTWDEAIKLVDMPAFEPKVRIPAQRIYLPPEIMPPLDAGDM